MHCFMDEGMHCATAHACNKWQDRRSQAAELTLNRPRPRQCQAQDSDTLPRAPHLGSDPSHARNGVL